MNKVHFSSQTGEWETPQALFDPLDAEFHFTLDVCATAENAKCKRYFTKADDGLVQDWRGEMCWMNPPYGREIGGWIEKACMEGARGAVVFCLLPARTDTRWWHNWVQLALEVWFLKGRVCFELDGKPILDKNGKPTGAPFPSALVRFGGKLKSDDGRAPVYYWDWHDEAELKPGEDPEQTELLTDGQD